MKAGIITIHGMKDYGTVMQVWALQKVLSEYGLETGVIEYSQEKTGSHSAEKKQSSVKLFGNIGFFRNLGSNQTDKINKLQAFITENINVISSAKADEKLDTAGFCPDAYIAIGEQTFSSASEEECDLVNLPEGFGSEAIKLSYTADFGVNDIKPMKKVIDPILLLNHKDYQEVIGKSTLKKQYIMAYMDQVNPGRISVLKRIAEILELPIISENKLEGIKNQLSPYHSAEVEEFLGLLEGASYFVTDSYYGVLFAVLFEKPFLAVINSEKDRTTADLLENLGLKSHILADHTELTDKSVFLIDNPKQLNKQISKLREYSAEFLVKHLGLSDRYKKVKCPTKISKEKCYGCGACADICRAGAIRMKKDKEGFLYPVTDKNKCTDCGLCSKVCIRKSSNVINFSETFPKAYAAYNLDQDIRYGSSSGAVYPALARYAVDERKGAVVGVRFNENMKAVADIADNLAEARKFSGSKYVKSDFRGIFPKVKELLTGGKFVLYTGLPCECAGLRSYLRKDYENLLVCELVCHASPSPKVLEKYIEYLNTKYGSQVKNIVFRDKKAGWKIGEANMVITLENGETHRRRSVEDPYFKAFLSEFTIRPSCNNCEYVYTKRAGDITIGDCWGIERAAAELFDDKGVSMILVNNSKGEEAWNQVKDQFRIKENEVKEIFYKNHVKPSKDRRKRTAFFNELDQQPIENLLKKYNEK